MVTFKPFNTCSDLANWINDQEDDGDLKKVISIAFDGNLWILWYLSKYENNDQ